MRRTSFVGTAQYVSPEVLEGEPVSPATDLWAFGVVIYQFLTGKHAFHDESEYLMYKRIQKLLYTYPVDFPNIVKDLIDRLLVIKPENRLGAEKTGGPEAIRSHKFFDGVDWNDLINSEPPPLPLKMDLSNSWKMASVSASAKRCNKRIRLRKGRVSVRVQGRVDEPG
ncbi:hypothetical protein TELCIR_05785 [Teladorsagia circumcincta]|uniref:Protein kinase domain-containing protein n=1 Tax=Teladorsagia circumcincta TaxID=45464 RepID=A0A2G9US13_TELCI|nr:hypothetical protein TELCIR_05785 [Teladorsagia circumcincta]